MRRRNREKSMILALSVSLFVILFLLGGVLLMRWMNRESELALYPRGYQSLVEQYAAENGLPQGLVYAVIRCESGFDPEATSRVGAQGLMQLMPDTYAWIAWRLKEETVEGGAFRPEVNIRYGCHLLGFLYERYGDWELVLAAYNAGFGNVDRWLADTAVSDGESLHEIPFAETRNYVPKVMAAWHTYDRLYGEV